jgi:hypothetical protein
MAADFYGLASNMLLAEDDLVVDGDWLSDEEKVGLRIVTDAEWDEMAHGLAQYLEMAAVDWINDNVKVD